MSIRDLVPWKREVPVRREYTGMRSPFEEMNRLFDDLFENFAPAPFRAPLSWADGFGGVPRVDVSEDDTALIVNADLPGVDEKDLDVSVSENTLTIAGERRDETEHHGRDVHWREQSYGSFQRRIPLPCNVEPDQVEASFKRGVLTVRLPKSEAARRLKVAVRAA